MKNCYSYDHKIQYYETDGMRIVHHSNYIRWMEEARSAYMDALGYGYAQMESEGVSIPVIGISCQYKSMMRFGQTCRIELRITAVSQVRMSVAYEFYNAEDGTLCCTGSSDHCFVNQDGKPVSLKRRLPHAFDLFCSIVSGED